MLDLKSVLWYNEDMSKENLTQKVLDLLEKHGMLTMNEIEKKLNNYSRYLYLTLKQHVASGKICCINKDIYVFGSKEDLMKKLSTEPSVSMPEWYKPELYYVPLVRTGLINHLIATKPELTNFDNDKIMMAQAMYVWYCLAHPKLDSSYLTAKEYDLAEAESQFNQLVQDITLD